ncbi:MAG: hypothetical protein Q4A37_03280 [Candidatus Saccharibacteria bacterium]|nr:hypothetical protein [Candidatus Saccharibacteria bacterium]
MTEATTIGDYVARPEHEQANAELLDSLEQYLAPLKLLADFPVDSHDARKMMNWLEGYSTYYDDDEGLQAAVTEVQDLDPEQLAIEVDAITKEARQCQPLAKRLYDTLGEIMTLYDAVVAVYDQPLDAVLVQSEATAMLEDAAQRAYDEESGRRHRSLNRIFPPHLAEVKVPEGCAVTIPTVKRWQRDHDITSRELADQEYMRLAVDARQGVEQDLAATDYVVFAVTAVVPDDMQMTMPQSVHDELHRCVARMEDADNSAQEMSDQLSRQLVIAQRCAAALQSHVEMPFDMLNKQYASDIAEGQLEEVKTTARGVASQRFIEVLTQRLDVLDAALKLYTVAPGLAASGLAKTTTKKKKRKQGGGRISRRARYELGRFVKQHYGRAMSCLLTMSSFRGLTMKISFVR